MCIPREEPIICQVAGLFFPGNKPDDDRFGCLPRQCCGKRGTADSIYRCEVIGEHTVCVVGWHTILHDRYGNGYACAPGIEKEAHEWEAKHPRLRGPQAIWRRL